MPIFAYFMESYSSLDHLYLFFYIYYNHNLIYRAELEWQKGLRVRGQILPHITAVFHALNESNWMPRFDDSVIVEGHIRNMKLTQSQSAEMMSWRAAL